MRCAACRIKSSAVRVSGAGSSLKFQISRRRNTSPTTSSMKTLSRNSRFQISIADGLQASGDTKQNHKGKKFDGYKEKNGVYIVII